MTDFAALFKDQWSKLDPDTTAVLNRMYTGAEGETPVFMRTPEGALDWPRIVVNRSDSERRFAIKTSRAARRAPGPSQSCGSSATTRTRGAAAWPSRPGSSSE